jgi:hypothetical protein
MTATTFVTAMSEAELQGNVIDLAHLLGFRVAHFRPARTATGWRTPVAADGAGWPDLTLVRGDRLVFVELKRSKGKVTEEQQAWLEALGNVAEVYVWRPADWVDGTIETLLRQPAEISTGYHRVGGLQ